MNSKSATAANIVSLLGLAFIAFVNLVPKKEKRLLPTFIYQNSDRIDQLEPELFHDAPTQKM